MHPSTRCGVASQDREYILHDADAPQPEPEREEAAGVAIAEVPLDIDLDLPAGFLAGALLRSMPASLSRTARPAHHLMVAYLTVPRWVFLTSARLCACLPIDDCFDAVWALLAGVHQQTGCHADESQPKAEPDDGLDWETIGPNGVALPPEAKLDIGPTESSGAHMASP